MTSSALTVEITEDFVLGNLDRARTVLNGLRERGITIAIDDFGSGYSSLARLRDLPVQMLKVDRSFLGRVPHDPGSSARGCCWWGW